MASGVGVLLRPSVQADTHIRHVHAPYETCIKKRRNRSSSAIVVGSTARTLAATERYRLPVTDTRACKSSDIVQIQQHQHNHAGKIVRRCFTAATCACICHGAHQEILSKFRGIICGSSFDRYRHHICQARVLCECSTMIDTLYAVYTVSLLKKNSAKFSA